MTVVDKPKTSIRQGFSEPVLISLALMAVLIFGGFVVVGGDLGSFSTMILSGLFQGMLLFLVASGLSIIFGLMDVLNFAQGVFFMIGAYVAYDFHHRDTIIAIIPNSDLRFFLSILTAILVGILLGGFVERGLLRPLYDRPIFQIVLTFGLSIVLTEIVKFIWSTTPYSWTGSFSVSQASFNIFGQSFSTYRLFVIVVGAIMMIAVTLLLQRTRIGIIIRAGVEDSEMVEALGINVRAVFTLVFMLGCALATFGGAIAAPFLGATPSLGNAYLLGAIAIVALGGLDSYEGAAVASIVVGVGVAVMQRLALEVSFIGNVWASLTPMLLLTLVLLLRPSGLFGKRAE